MRLICTFVALAVLLSAAPVVFAQDCAPCAAAQKKDAWCDGCKVGYIGGEKTKCRSCFDIRTSTKAGWCEGCKVGYAKGVKTSCKSCLNAIDADSWCDDCKVGYANAQKTKCKSCHVLMKVDDGGWCDGCNVGYARGVQSKCKSCLDAIRKDGWCDGCKAGYVGAQKTTCKSCYGLMKTADGGWCDGCKVGYVGGKKTKCRSCFDLMISKDGGWCADCSVGHAKGLKTKCRKCFDAIRANGACEDCERRFQDGSAFRTVHLHVRDIKKEKIEAILKGMTGISKVQFPERDRVDFELNESSKTRMQDVLDAIQKAGFEAHEGKE